MLFIQVKSLAYFIFVTIVACQIAPGIYTIRNRQEDNDVLAAASPNPSEGVIGIPLAQDPGQLAEWDISPGPPSQFAIKNLGTNTYLSDDGGQVALADDQFYWIINGKDDGFAIISSSNPDYLSLIPSPDSDSDSVILTAAEGPNSYWIFTPTP